MEMEDVGRLAPKKNVLTVWKRGVLGCCPAKPETKMPPAGKCAHRVFAPEKFALAFFCLPAEFCSAAFGSRCGIPWKDQTEEIKKIRKNFAPMEKNPAYCIYKK